jgi:AraC family transcriptional regulator
MMLTDGLSLVQQDGGLPTTRSSSAPGETGVSVASVRFERGLHFSGIPQQHLVWFNLSPPDHFDCRIAGQELRHEPPTGSLAICPAGVEGAADTAHTVDALVVAVDPGRFSLAAAECSALGSRLDVRLVARDAMLLDVARRLASESDCCYINGPLFWSELAQHFIDGLLARFSRPPESCARGTLGKDVLKCLKDYVMAHLDEPIELETLAGMAGRSPFHFTRVFSKSVGLTPHRYVVYLRVRRAIELARGGRHGLAEIAARTGFADQSHLSRWIRRIHGVSIRQLLARA